MSAPPRALEGERSEMKPNFFLYTAEVQINGKPGKKFSFWNATDETQFKVTFSFGEPEDVKLLQDDVVKKDDVTYFISLYPGEAKEFLQGRFKSVKRGLAFGAPDKAWAEKKASESNEDVALETLAIRAALKANPSKDGRYTSEYIASVAIKEQIPFVDLTFPPKTQSIYRDFEAAGCTLKSAIIPWKRPAEYCPKGLSPKIFEGKIEPADFDQGRLGNCYMLGALSAAAEFPEIIKGIFNVERDPELGIYRVRVCKNGWWQLVTVDDLLPMDVDKPLFAKNKEEPNEVWISLLEKVYAKLHGSYQAICKGDSAQALADFFGVPYYKYKDTPYWADKDKLFEQLCKWDSEDACQMLGTPGKDPNNNKIEGAETALVEKYKKVGLVTGHAFTMIAAKQWNGHHACQIRNPWGGEHEWNGKFGDKDECWKNADMRKAFDFNDEADGSFWMPANEVWNWFDTGSVAHMKCLTKYSSLRIAGNFDKGIPDVVLKITVTGTGQPVKIFSGVHQKDPRGLPPGDRDAKYLGMMISVVKQGADGKCKVFGKSGESYMITRDLFVETELERGQASEPFFVIPQCYSEDDKSFVLSLFLDDTSNVSIEFVGYKEGLGKKINNAALFVPSNCAQKVAAQVQYMTPAMKNDWVEAESNSVDFSQAMAAHAKKPKLPGRISNEVDVAKVKAAEAKAHAMAGKAAASGVIAGTISILVTCISGENLRSTDANGLADPYVVVAVQDKSGKTRGDVEAQSTKYVTKNLNPTWGDVFKFDELASDNSFYLQVLDKDQVGSDDTIGTATVSLASLGLKKGGPGKVLDLELSPAGGGKIKVMFAM